MNAITLVVPCFNEAARLDGRALVGLVDAHAALRLLLVDVVGYFDADLSTPPPEILRLVEVVDTLTPLLSLRPGEPL